MPTQSRRSRFAGGPAALVDLCFEPVGFGATSGWNPLERFVYPFALPVRHPDYPANSQAPDAADSQATALGRITYGPPGQWATGFPDLHETLQLLVAGGPAGASMADKLHPPAPGVPDAVDAPAPHLANTRALDLVRLATVNRAVADMIGLAFVDEMADPAKRYDYLIVAGHSGAGAGSASDMLNEIAANGFANVDGYIVSDKTIEPSPALAPPTGARAYALPGTTLATQGAALTDATNNAGLRWTLPVVGGHLLPEHAVLYLIWRANFGNGDSPAPAAFNLRTQSPILVTEPKVLLPALGRSAPRTGHRFHCISSMLGSPKAGTRIARPASTFSDGTVLRVRVPSGINGRRYRSQTRAITSIRRRIEILARLCAAAGESPPPAHPYDQALAGPSRSNRAPRRRRSGGSNALSATSWIVVGSRVRWQWTADLAQQAPDATEFRIYYQPGQPNVWPGDITAVAVASPNESLVTTDIANQPQATRWWARRCAWGRRRFP